MAQEKSVYSERDSIIDSFRFYIMIGILVAKTAPEKANISIDRFKKELRESGLSENRLNYYIHQASVSIPTDFNKITELEGVYFKERQTFIGKK